MATGLAIGVTVVGVAAILALFGLLARQFGLWAWALNWVRATKEEKTKLCHHERDSSGRTYMVRRLPSCLGPRRGPRTPGASRGLPGSLE